MEPQSIFEVLCGQQLTAVQAVERWGRDLAPGHDQNDWPLFGALALVFETHVLLLISPLRSLRSQQGTRYGLSDGHSVDLGLRALLCETEQADAIIGFRLGMPVADAWCHWGHVVMPIVGSRLHASPWLHLLHDAPLASVLLDFGADHVYRLEYRPDLDGAIELCPQDTRSDPPSIRVESAKGPLSWLHPDRIAGFTLDDRRWRSVTHWPIEVRRRYRNAGMESPGVRPLLKRAWLAYFRQNPHMGRRLLALRVPVQVAGVPDGFIAEVQADLRADSGPAEPTDNASSAGPASTL